MRTKTVFCTLLIVAGLLLGTSCGNGEAQPNSGNHSPGVIVPRNIEFFVGLEKIVDIIVRDVDGDTIDKVTFEVRTTTDFRRYDITDRARIEQVPDGAKFYWTPATADIGKFTVNIRAFDSHGHVGASAFVAHIFAKKP